MKTVLQLIYVSLLIVASYAAQAKPAVIAPKADSSLLLDVVKVSDNRLITVGERGHILISEDDGSSWRQVEVPVDVNLTAVDFLDEKHGVAVGFDQTILLTEDSGETWTISHQKVSNYQPALFSVLYNTRNRITAVGSYGLYLETSDGGDTWNTREVASLSDVYDGFSHFYDLEKRSADTWFIAGEKYIAEANDEGEEFSKGMVAVTHDAGRTWKKLNSPYEGSFFGISVTDSGIYVYGLRGNLFHSVNEGESWNKVMLKAKSGKVESGLHDMLITPNGTLVLVGTAGALIRKQNEQVTVAKRADLKGRAALLNLGEENYIIVGEGGVESYTPDDKDKESALKGQ
ncbi:WD40/YVTN/BNR-like repeat-containing protein [Kangiella sediminilitoris]|uniref:Photosynthesis system II assembly factor Ycf48/Hcf136-like domain-containing protein n=1 Tax=Kangiella sediminilitoris TaxID=1144748 RepID=A0A1B3B929_9GAMM|nr:YCF48-related protein [Kangiella sediminilitoris]AOE49309.1 hypothetical protein KS2013_585 [Kangiella sediminilitoris]